MASGQTQTVSDPKDWVTVGSSVDDWQTVGGPGIVGSPEFNAMLQRAKLRNATGAMREADAAAQNPMAQPQKRGESFPASFGRQAIGGVADAVSGAVKSSIPQNPLEAALFAMSPANLMGKHFLESQANEFQHGAVPAAGLLPVIGPMAGEMGRKFGAGDYGGGAVDAAQLMAMAAGLAKGGIAGIKARQAAKALEKSDVARGDLIDTMVSGTKNTKLDNPLDLDEPANFDVAMPEIVRASEKPITKPLDAYRAAGKAGQFRNAEFQERITEPLALREDVRPGLSADVVEQAKEYNTSTFKRGHPLLSKLIDGEVLNWKQMYEANVDINAKLKTLSEMTPEKQRIKLNDPNWGWLEKVSQDLKKNMYEAVPDGKGSAVREANRLIGRIGSVRELLEPLAIEADRSLVKGTSEWELGLSPHPSMIVGGHGGALRAATGGLKLRTEIRPGLARRILIYVGSVP